MTSAAATPSSTPASDCDRPATTQTNPRPSRGRFSKLAGALWSLGLCLTAAVLHAVPWLWEGWFWCSWLGIALALYLVSRTGWVAAWWLTWLWSTAALTLAFHWSPSAMAYTLSSGLCLGVAVAFPFLMWDGLRLAAGYWLAARMTHDVRWLWLPASLWTVTLEWAMPSVFPWRLGLPQLTVPWLIQPVDIFGGGWTTLIAFAHAGLIVNLVWGLVERRARCAHPATADPTDVGLPRTWRMSVVGAGVLLLANASYGWWSMAKWQGQAATAPQIHLGLVQVDPSYTWSVERMRQLTQQVAPQADLICWPESSGGYYDMHLLDLSDPDEVFAHSRQPERGLQPWPDPSCELLLGGKCYRGDAEHPDELHVSAMLIDGVQKISARYHKRFLMPFGEYVPFEQSVPGLSELFDMAEHVQPGRTAQPLLSQTGARLGVMLCYEDMVPQAAYEAVGLNANLLVSLANGSAFESPFTLTQHRLLSQLRAVECRKFFVRCAATGESCTIAPTGEITQRLPLQTDAALLASAPLLSGNTLFTRLPWLGTALSALGLLAVAAASWFRTRGLRDTRHCTAKQGYCPR